LGDPTKAKKQLGWQPKTSFVKLVKMMIEEDLTRAKKDVFCKESGFKVNEFHE
jgi:GDPmannose 4,6-dehydratase